ncbi:uncharacterized protein LOC121342705 [Onychostruthus taczanowskii]|uniref:uncharacterized protein LOC121342705 n=1 Tax=Onychostruthus taczanowskii TaxID=356909 RepID=UPI001B80C839|nr:uncharacterized protein LOC121342705 [Onychostruthus taczanowskii]
MGVFRLLFQTAGEKRFSPHRPARRLRGSLSLTSPCSICTGRGGECRSEGCQRARGASGHGERAVPCPPPIPGLGLFRSRPPSLLSGSFQEALRRAAVPHSLSLKRAPSAEAVAGTPSSPNRLFSATQQKAPSQSPCSRDPVTGTGLSLPHGRSGKARLNPELGFPTWCLAELLSPPRRALTGHRSFSPALPGRHKEAAFIERGERILAKRAPKDVNPLENSTSCPALRVLGSLTHSHALNEGFLPQATTPTF